MTDPNNKGTNMEKEGMDVTRVSIRCVSSQGSIQHIYNNVSESHICYYSQTSVSLIRFVNNQQFEKERRKFSERESGKRMRKKGVERERVEEGEREPRDMEKESASVNEKCFRSYCWIKM